AAAKYGFAPGVWMSPWGGYSKPKQERVKYGEAEGFEIVNGGFALSGAKYYQRFRDVCLTMMRDQGVNQFKFDGTGNVNHVVPGSHFDSDFDAMIHLIGELREAKPDIYINLTTGTTASPFWLRYADSIWRGGEDDSLTGVGTKREQWITYRDAQTYQRVVSRGPLFPLNSLMLHGIIYARYNPRLKDDPGDDFANEVRSYFGTGTQLQEMYLTPDLLSKKNWDVLAEAARWSRKNADVLKDSHWVGGDPDWLQVYGWASWSKEKSILVLRNPSDKPQEITLDAGAALELPVGAARRFRSRSPWGEDASKPEISLVAGTPHRFQLKPFQVLTLDLEPAR
ncbi:MAG TPA: enterotoxin, partial [Edaphobacter sp.]|nr:enterotoxin [Edaphobacter sp.]